MLNSLKPLLKKMEKRQNTTLLTQLAVMPMLKLTGQSLRLMACMLARAKKVLRKLKAVTNTTRTESSAQLLLKCQRKSRCGQQAGRHSPLVMLLIACTTKSLKTNFRPLKVSKMTFNLIKNKNVSTPKSGLQLQAVLLRKSKHICRTWMILLCTKLAMTQIFHSESTFVSLRPFSRSSNVSLSMLMILHRPACFKSRKGKARWC